MNNAIKASRLMFDRKNMKYHDNSNEGIDLDSAPSRRSLLRSEEAIHTFSLASSVEEIMESEDFMITYRNHG